MKFVIFTPALQSSAIGRMACLVTRALLAAGHGVTTVRAESDDLLAEPHHDFGTALLPWTDPVQVHAAIGEADVVLYHVGDNYRFHRGCMEYLPSVPGLICLHDFFVGHLFWAWAEQRKEEAHSVLRNWYGEAAAASYFSHGNSEAFIQGTHLTAPMTEWIAAMATGVITHSSWGIARVLAGCPGPVRVAALPYDAAAPQLRASAGGDTLQVLTIGHVNPNKRVASVIRAIGASEVLRTATAYRLVGAIAPAVVASLSALARNNEVQLLISDAVETPVLNRAMDEADVIVCLRYPSLEAASASAIEAMLHGKAVIVTDTNFYQELPDNCVIKIDPNDELASLQRALERLHGDRALCREMGARAQQWARATFCPQRYAASVVEMAQAASEARPVLGAMAAFGAMLHNWGGDPAMLSGPHVLQPLQLFNYPNEATGAPSALA